MPDQKPIAICLMGPTASGKTDLAVELTRRIPCDIISVDSGMVYRGMDIGTAKPDRKTLQQAPHRLIDIRDPAQPYSAAEFRRDALEEIEKILGQGRIPLLVGGTMLYFKVLCQGIAPMPAANQAVRDRIQSEADTQGWESLHRRLAGIDPAAAAKIHPNNPQRLMRALEVYELTGVPMGEHWRAHQKQSDDLLPCRFTQFALQLEDRKELHRKIAVRFELMLEQGLVAEVETLYRRGDLSSAMPSIRAVGYRQVWDYLEGCLSYQQMAEKAIIATRQLAKRQLTWLRGWPELLSLDVATTDLAGRVLKTMNLTQYRSDGCRSGKSGS